MNLIEQIIQGCITGDRYCQTRLYNLLAPVMYPVCMRYASGREDAEDILQDGFIKVFQHLNQYRFEGSFEGWVRTIMVNSALHKYRNKLNVTDGVENHENTFFLHEDITTNIEVKALVNMVQALPPAYRLVFNLYVFEGMKHREIATVLGISEGTSKSNLSDARKLLQKAVEKSRRPVELNIK